MNRSRIPFIIEAVCVAAVTILMFAPERTVISWLHLGVRTPGFTLPWTRTLCGLMIIFIVTIAFVFRHLRRERVLFTDSAITVKIKNARCIYDLQNILGEYDSNDFTKEENFAFYDKCHECHLTPHQYSLLYNILKEEDTESHLKHQITMELAGVA
jgi:hypothetical protein